MYPEGAPSGDKFQSVQVNFSQPPPPNSSISFLPPGQEISRQVFLLPQASSDCTNADVRLPDALTRGGSATVDRGADGNTHVRVRLAGQPSTSYHFFLKCGRQLGDLMTQANSAGIANFNFPTAEVGNVFAFEMYPEGAPPESRYQSLQVRFPETPAAVPSPRIEYIDQTAGSVNFTFADLPAGVEVVYVDSTSGDVRAASPVYAISQGGAGSASIAIDAQTPRNCYLLVRDQSGKHYIAQTIKFYIWN
jgi:hypothetical protein